MAQGRLIGQNYTTPDLVAKVTGRARYAEDYRAEGMLFCKLLLSPMPHCRIRRIDTAAALAIPGVRAVLTADDLPPVKARRRRTAAGTGAHQRTGLPGRAGAGGGRGGRMDRRRGHRGDHGGRRTRCRSSSIPIASLRPGGANAREQGNAFVDGKVATVKWTADVFAAAGDGMLPLGDPGTRWAYGDVEAGFARRRAGARRDLPDATPPGTSRSRRGRRWRTGRTASSSSTARRRASPRRSSRWPAGSVSMRPQVVIVSEYTGGGFGSKIPGAHTMAIPALLAKKPDCR